MTRSTEVPAGICSFFERSINLHDLPGLLSEMLPGTLRPESLFRGGTHIPVRPLSSDSSQQNFPRWTLPPRREISPESLHISSFVVVKKRMTGESNKEGEPSILLLRAGDRHPLSFRRGKLLLPATILSYAEQPRTAARRIMREQLGNPEGLGDPEFLKLLSYVGAHWDIVVLFQAWFDGEDLIQAREPFVQGGFYDANSLPRKDIAEDHLEVIDSMLNPSDDATV